MCKNDGRIQSSKSLYQIEAACIQKAGSIADILCTIPQVLPKVCFQTKPDTGSDINYIYIRESVSLSFLSIPHQTCPRDSAYPAVVSFETVIGFLSGALEPDQMLKDERVLFKAFVRLIGLENSTDKSWGQRSLEWHR